MATIKGFAVVKVWTDDEIERALFGKRCLQVHMNYDLAAKMPKPEDDRF